MPATTVTSPQLGGAFDPAKDIDLQGTVATSKGITSYGTAGIGYSTGAGGSVTQITSRSTAVTLNAICGKITTDTTSLAAEGSAAFTVNNSYVAADDVVVVCQRSGSNGGNTEIQCYGVAAGSFTIRVSNNNASAGTAETGAIIINFAVVKAVSA